MSDIEGDSSSNTGGDNFSHTEARLRARIASLESQLAALTAGQGAAGDVYGYDCDGKMYYPEGSGYGPTFSKHNLSESDRAECVPLCRHPSPASVSVEGWISVTDRVPFVNQRVLGCHGFGRDIHIFDWFGHDKFGVTHWMPLPSPPEAQQP